MPAPTRRFGEILARALMCLVTAVLAVASAALSATRNGRYLGLPIGMFLVMAGDIVSRTVLGDAAGLGFASIPAFLAQALLGAGRADEAIAAIDRAMTLAPMEPDFAMTRADALTRVGRLPDAAEALWQMVERERAPAKLFAQLIEVATKMHASDRQLDVRVQLPRVDRSDAEDVARIQVGVIEQVPVLLSSVAELERAWPGVTAMFESLRVWPIERRRSSRAPR